MDKKQKTCDDGGHTDTTQATCLKVYKPAPIDITSSLLLPAPTQRAAMIRLLP